jgi:hypothetical protein
MIVVPRGEWEKMVDEWTKLAKQTVEQEDLPVA